MKAKHFFDDYYGLILLIVGLLVSILIFKGEFISELEKGWNAEQRQSLRDAVPAQGLDAVIAGRKLRDIARDALAISRHGLARRRRLDEAGRDESRYLDWLDQRVAGGSCAQAWLKKFHGDWRGSVDPVFAEAAF